MAIIVNLDAIKLDRKSTRLNSSHSQISYAVFCLKKKLIPVFVLRGTIPPPGPLYGLPKTPSTLAMLGPVRSASRTPTSYPLLFSSDASMLVTKDFPTPPFPEITAIILRTPRFPRRSIPGPTPGPPLDGGHEPAPG